MSKLYLVKYDFYKKITEISWILLFWTKKQIWEQLEFNRLLRWRVLGVILCVRLPSR